MDTNLKARISLTIRAEFSILAMGPGGMSFLQTAGSLMQIVCRVNKGSEAPKSPKIPEH
jgi:hypothetical protein